MRICWGLFLIAIALGQARADDAPAKPKRYATLLEKECDALIAAAVKRPYGWGWAEVVESPELKKTVAVRNPPVSLEPGMTPAAGLILYWASDVLNEPKYADAARNVGRGVAAAEESTGKFPSVALFGSTSVSSKEPGSPLPDRASTRAAVGLLLSLIDDKKPQETIDRAGARGVKWLMRQQAESGAWLAMFPPGASAQEGVRIARLDTRETRDSTLAVLLGYEVLGDPFQRRSVERSVDFLMKTRIAESTKIGAGLWRGAYTVNAIEAPTSAAFPDAIDTLASRYSMQAIFSAWVVLGDASRLSACEVASKSLKDLIKGDDGLWHRHFGFRGGSMDMAAEKAAASPFGVADFAPERAPVSDPGLAKALETVAAGKELGREKFRERLNFDCALKQHLARVICGLEDGSMSSDFPATVEVAQAYLKRHEEQFGLIEGASPSDLAGKIKRLWAICLRARVEGQFGI
jgi:hypothetical protein